VRVVILGVMACSFTPTALGPPAQPVDGPPAQPIDSPPAPIDSPVAPVDAPGTWACGTEPMAPPNMVTIGNPTTGMTASNIAIGSGQLAIVAPGGNLAVAFDYAIHDTACMNNCIDQIEVGFDPGHRAGCIYDHSTPKATGANGQAQGTFAVPTTPGSYDVRIAIGQNTGCTDGGHTDWWNGPPPAGNTVARLCVH
jgi:hypothetical protein